MIWLLAGLLVESSIPPKLSALCPKAAPGEIVVCADLEPPKSPYRLPLRMPPERGSKNSISVSRERNALFDYDAGGAGSCSASGLAGIYGCGFKAHKAWVEQRAGARSGGGRIYDEIPE
ncbi:MAG: hypothetical protein ACOYLS_13180 [Polymorphobacter sp.]